MQRKVRMLCTVIAVVLAFAVLTGCSMFQKNEQRYRAQTAITVGNEVIKLEDVMEFFGTNGAQYIQYGYDAQTVWDALIPQYISQAIAVNEYKTSYKGTTYDGVKNQKYTDGKYYTETELTYFEKQVQHDIFNSLNTLVETELTNNGFKIAKAEDKRAELTEIVIKDTIANAEREEAFNMEKLDKKLESFKAQTSTTSLDYIFTDEKDERLLKTVEELNKRIDEKEEKKVTVTDYIEAQKEAMQSFERNIINSYYDNLDDYFASRVDTFIRAQLYADYQTEYYNTIENDEIKAVLNQKLDYLKAQAVEGYTLNVASFESFITGLASTSFIYDVPTEYEGAYGYVKNLLIPFSTEQTEILTAYKNTYGANSNEYLAKRAELATKIKVTDFIDAPDAEDDAKANAGFTTNSNYEVNGSTFFGDKVTGVDANAFIELMFRYNTDTAQHNSAYDYIIAKKAPDATGTADKWVAEFAKVARELANNGTIGGVGYALTDYGVHVIWYAGDVTADSFNFDAVLGEQTGAGTAAYRFYKTYVDAVKSSMFSDKMDELYKSYNENKKINVKNNVLKDYAESYGITLKK